MDKIVQIIWFASGRLHLVTLETGAEYLMSGAEIMSRTTWKEIHR